MGVGQGRIGGGWKGRQEEERETRGEGDKENGKGKDARGKEKSKEGKATCIVTARTATPHRDGVFRRRPRGVCLLLLRVHFMCVMHCDPQKSRGAGAGFTLARVV